MPLLNTARTHFDEDIGRARALVDQAVLISASTTLREDIFRAAWMMAVGASDAFFCDAYADLAARTLQARQIQSTFRVTDRILNLKVPAIAVIGTAGSENWRWRMVARQIIENETVLSITKIKSLLNQFCRKDHKPFSKGNYDQWIVHIDSKQRLFGISPTKYRQLRGSGKNIQRKKSIEKFELRFETIFQRRHDCIHNCDRPKVALDSRNLNKTAIEKVIFDIVFLVSRIQEAITNEFQEWLKEHGATGKTRGRVS